MRALFALFIRSLREDSRSRLPYIFRCALVVIILLIIYANQRSFRYQTAPGREFLIFVMMLNLGFIALTALSIFTTAITEEKEDGTLPLLRMTNLNPFSILLGKAGSRLLGALLLLGVQIPFTLLAITLGGVSSAQIYGGYAVLGATTFFLCNLSLLASVICRTGLRAGALTAFAGMMLYAGVIFIAEVTRNSPARGGNAGTSEVLTYLYNANPLYVLAMMITPFRAGPGISTTLEFHLIGGVVCFLLAWVLFTRFCATSEEAPARRARNADGKPRRLWFRKRPGRVWGKLALVWKDFHFLAGGRFGFLVRITLAGTVWVLSYLFINWEQQERLRYMAAQGSNYWSSYYGADYVMRNVSESCIGFACVFAGVELLLMAGRVFGSERRRLTLSSLVALPWTTWRLVWQKVLGSIAVLAPWVLLAIAGVLTAPHYWGKEFSELFEDPRTWDWTWENDKDEIAVTCYIGLQALLALWLIVWFSLRIRRGALPAAIACMAVWNIFFVMLVEEAHGRDNEVAFLLFGAILTLSALIWMTFAIARRIQLAAAED